MPALRKVLIGGGTLAVAAIAAISLYLWLALPSCTLLIPSEVAAPNGQITALVESRTCSKPTDDWATVTLSSREGSERPMVFRLLEASGSIGVRWDDASRLEIRYPSNSKTWKSTQPPGWPSIQFIPSGDL
jgi:hypothetical protein